MNEKNKNANSKDTNNRQEGPAKKSRSRNRNRNRNKNSGAKNNSKQNKPGNFIIKYQNILEQYWSVRKKYFELFFRADPKQKAKLERNYQSELKKLNDFEARLNAHQKEELQLHVKGKNLDTTYSENHHIETENDENSLELEGESVLDPHYLESQQSESFKNDNEESVGNIEDYQSYKAGIS